MKNDLAQIEFIKSEERNKWRGTQDDIVTIWSRSQDFLLTLSWERLLIKLK